MHRDQYLILVILPLFAWSVEGFLPTRRPINNGVLMPTVRYAEETEDFIEPPEDSNEEVGFSVEDMESNKDEEITSIVDKVKEVTVAENIAHEEETAPEASTAPSISTEEAILKVLQMGASTGRGEFATVTQKDQAMEWIAAIERSNPTPEPSKSSKMQGRWELLFCSTQLFRSSPFFMAGRAVCSTPEQAKQYDWFCDMHRAALAISTIGQVRQVVSKNRLVSEFEVSVGAVPFLSDFTPFSYSGGLPVTIEGSIVSSADITPTEDGEAWELLMDTGTLSRGF